eukprot:CAMPEP_0181242712 /NCGR_PEP_ID=MMETSP1096-20121128/41845_1 /TAXON_ID=156174 ORGANISM="Chrysochromulina ericina, Strain CCMP281" /NCGR_SAMPLE_ID=MMETSP1096 /ASSEMBLY_ACC=CAM_ASM_000453 /LENGTH=51 /DNA_ID=CAMNT_0023338957 /DNA_START=20 /DNA_END=175 /DNA_ORIENTATION=+
MHGRVAPLTSPRAREGDTATPHTPQRESPAPSGAVKGQLQQSSYREAPTDP